MKKCVVVLKNKALGNFTNAMCKDLAIWYVLYSANITQWHTEAVKITSVCPCLLLRNLNVLRDCAICRWRRGRTPLRTLSWLSPGVLTPSPWLVGVDTLLSSPARHTKVRWKSLYHLKSCSLIKCKKYQPEKALVSPYTEQQWRLMTYLHLGHEILTVGIMLSSDYC